MKLSKTQIKCLAALEAGERSAYPGLHMGALNSLSLKKLVGARYPIGSIAMPHSCIQWSITDAGRAALAEQKDRTNG